VVRVLVRDPSRIAQREWAGQVEVAVGDLVTGEGIEEAARGVAAAYYLVHAMTAGRGFAERDRRAALNFTAVARKLRHVIYLGGLLPSGKVASEHLRSRAEVGAILRDGLPMTEIRAGPIVGSGSASFELVRYLGERMPLVVAPRWIRNEIQPAAVRDILAYLMVALEVGPLGVLEVGGDRLTFQQMLRTYAEVRGYRRVIASARWLPAVPRLAAAVVNLFTPVPGSLGLPLIQGMQHSLVADTTRARELFPEVQPMPYREAVGLALRRTEDASVETRWSGALGPGPTYELHDWEGMIREVRSVQVPVRPEAVLEVVSSLGGDRGWLVWEWAWKLRGRLDRMFGGPGLRRGRRHPTEVLPGEAVDFWRVEAVDPTSHLRLRAEMKVPGRAWLEWQVREDPGGSRLIQRALFAPSGICGLVYWHGLYPIHRVIFNDLINAIARAASMKAIAEGEAGKCQKRLPAQRTGQPVP
jgi:uncharacterized protein YbjT (DUF2867 family)